VRPPRQVLLAGGIVGAQGLVGVAVALVFLVRAIGSGAPGAGIAEAVYFLLVGGAVLFAGTGLLRGKRWARTPAIVAQLLLLPVVYSLIGPSQQLVPGILAGLVVIGTFLLLISEPSRAWSMDLFGDDR
jgi:peptidoglycan/LPS O-acetylase OafA/YrhL